MSDGSIIIDTPEGIAMFRVLQLKYALKIELETGMSISRGGSLLKVVNREFGTSFKRKQQAYDFLCEITEIDA